MKLSIHLPTAKQLIKKKGLASNGHAQMFHTQNVLKRIKRYMPYRTGVTYKITVAQTNIAKPEIVTDVPYGKYLFYGKVMIDPKLGVAGFMTPEGWRSRKKCVKVLTGRDLQYTRNKNPREGKAMAADLQRYLNRR